MPQGSVVLDYTQSMFPVCVALGAQTGNVFSQPIMILYPSQAEQTI